MKRKVIKLFLLFSVIVLSLLFVSSCNETPPENPPEENQEENVYRKEIKDSEYIEFIFSEYMNRYSYLYSPAPYSASGLFDLYNIRIENPDIEIKEYTSAGKTKLIAGYLPKEYIELIFHKNADEYLNGLSGSSMYTIAEYLKRNGLSYTDIGFRLYYVSEKNVAPSVNDEFIVYMGEESFITDNDGNSIKFVGNNIHFRISQNNEFKFTNFAEPPFPLAIRFFAVGRNERFLKSFGAYCRIISTKSGIDIVYEDGEYIEISPNAKEFIEAFSSAELYVETKFYPNGEEYIWQRVYDYEMVKEILNIKS